MEEEMARLAPQSGLGENFPRGSKIQQAGNH